MNHKLKRKWINALRGGNYHKCTGALRLLSGDCQDQFCALGVLADVDGVNWKLGQQNAVNHVKKVLENDLHCSAEGIYYNMDSFVVRLNDKYGFSFNQIADWIEENVKDKHG